MAANAGPDIIEDGIVFYYDTGNTVKSYIGEPTTNLALDTLQQGGWPGTHTLISSGTKTFDLTTSTVEWGGNASWTMFYYDVTAYTGQHICLSATYEYSTSPGGGNLAFVMIGQTTGSETYLGYSSPLDYNSLTPTSGQQISWNGVIGNGGKIGILTWMSNGNSTTLTSRFSKVQLEVKTHPTQFVNGTRSVTQGLLDMSRNSTVNLTDVSFDSNAQMVFDGTNDYLTVPNNANIVPTSTTSWEFMLKPTGTTGYRAVFQKSNYGNSTGFISLFMNPGSLAFRLNASDVAESTRTLDHNFNGNITLNTYSHIVLTYNGSVFTLYINGTATNTGSWSYGLGTNQGDFLIGTFWAGPWVGNLDVVKQYSRVLSASEVLTNYNALKTRFGI